jgi:succinate dehydrogenase / fumarate reductase membrane anchor subunit
MVFCRRFRRGAQLDPVIRQVSKYSQRGGSVVNLYTWLFLRVSGLILLMMALFHLMYFYFGIPGGIEGITYATIEARWTDPAWGAVWRSFDAMLLLFGLTHGAVGLRQVLDDHIFHLKRRAIAKTALFAGYLFLLAMGATIIFSI